MLRCTWCGDGTLESELAEEGYQEAESSGYGVSDENLESESDDDDPDDRAAPQHNRPVREVRKPKIFSYDTVGGDPVYVEAKR